LFAVAISNDTISFNKESKLFAEFDMNSSGNNPVFREKEVVFNGIDPSDESSFLLLVLVEIKNEGGKISYATRGINAMPMVSSSDIILSGVFEVPFVELELSSLVFQELNNINPWQFQYRFLKDKKGSQSPITLIYRQCHTDISDMYPTEMPDDILINKLLMPVIDSTKKEATKSPPFKLSDCLYPDAYERDLQGEIREYIKDCLYKQ